MQEMLEELTTFLRNRIGLASKDLADVKRRVVVAKVLRSEPQEVAVFGIVLVNAPEDFFLERFCDIESYKKGTSVPQVRKFSPLPRIEDVQQLTAAREEFDALKKCRIGSCDVKLSAYAIARLRREIEWNARGAFELANESGTRNCSGICESLAGGRQ